MTTTITRVLEKCNIYLDDSLISREYLLKKYISFFAKTMAREQTPVGFSLHTGNICFDALSIVAVSLGCLFHMVSTIDDMIATLGEGASVIYEGQRYRWKGTTTYENTLYFILEQDGVGKQGPSKRWLPYHENRHGIKPYYGAAQSTNAVGLNGLSEHREHFLSYILDRHANEIPPQIDVSVVIACGRETFTDIFRRIRIEYGNGWSINLSDVLPASYYTDTDRPHQIGVNPTKAEPVLKVTANLSIARELIYDRSVNPVVGFLSLLDPSSLTDIEDLSDILRATTLKYSYITAPIYNKMLLKMIEEYPDAAVIACTKAFLSQTLGRFHVPYPHTKDLFRQVNTLLKNRMTPLPVERSISEAVYKEIRSLLDIIRSSNWDTQEKDTFIAGAYSLLNLFTTAVFSMEEMESAITGSIISVTSPGERIQTLRDIASQIVTDHNMQEKCAQVVDTLERQYNELYAFSPKREELRSCLEQSCPVHLRTHLSIIVPKAYYAEILKYYHRKFFDRNHISCVTPARFDPTGEYEVVISVGELKDKKYNPSACLSATEIYTLLAPCEERFFAYRQRAAEKFEHLLNMRMGLAEAIEPIDESDSDNFAEEELQYFTEPDADLSDFKLSTLRNYTSVSANDRQTTSSEVTHVGRFTTGEQILFSRYYTAVVFNPLHSVVTEKKAHDLRPGDTIVFTKRNSTTKNIVDMIYEELLHAGLLEEDAESILAKSLYWKTVLRVYKDKNHLSYGDLAKKFEECGTALREASIRQWLSEEAHIIGPQKLATLESISRISKDPFLQHDVQSYFDACAHVRSTRRRILTHIAGAISAQLSGAPASSDPILAIVASHIESLSETLELEDILPLDEPFSAKSSLVNRPITETEVTYD